MTIDLRYGDTIEQMKLIPDKSIDFICCDLPYGLTQNKEDIIIPFDKLWVQYERIIKDNGAIVLFASQPFTSTLVISKIDKYKHTVVMTDQTIIPIEQISNIEGEMFEE